MINIIHCVQTIIDIKLDIALSFEAVESDDSTSAEE